MNLSAWAGQAGVNRCTAYRWYYAGTLLVPAGRSGRLVLVELTIQPRGRAVVCARVLSVGQGQAWAGACSLTPGVATIAVEHRDGRARFGVEHIQAALAAQGRQIMILGPGELGDGLVRDMTEVLASFCACLYGCRGARNRALRALGCARAPASPAGGEAGA